MLIQLHNFHNYITIQVWVVKFDSLHKNELEYMHLIDMHV